MTRKIALLLGNGNYAAILQTRLRRDADIACMTVALFPDGLSGIADDKVDFMGALYRPSACIRRLRLNEITHVVLGGDVRLASLGPRNFVELGARAFGDPILFRMAFTIVRGAAPIALNVFSRAITARQIQPIHAAELLPELKVPDGVVARHGYLAEWTQSQVASFVALLSQMTLNDLRQQPFAHVRQALLFEGDRIVLRESRGTDLLLEKAAAIPRSQRPRTVVKLCPLGLDYRMDPPVVGLKTFELAAKAQVDLVVLDAPKGILVDRDEVLKLCADQGISLYGFPPS